MNEYKMAWMIATDNYPLNPLPKSGKSRSQNKSVAGQVKDHFVQHAIEYATLSALAHMAQSQLTGPAGSAARVIGRIGIRAVPIIAIGITAWEIYKWLDD